jgi:hypothetical protein
MRRNRKRSDFRPEPGVSARSFLEDCFLRIALIGAVEADFFESIPGTIQVSAQLRYEIIKYTNVLPNLAAQNPR